MNAYRPPAIFPILIHVVFACQLWLSVVSLVSLQSSLYQSIKISRSIEHPRKRIPIGKNIHTDIIFLKTVLQCFLFGLTCCWMSLVLLRSGDIHPNPGPTLPEISYNTNANNSLSTSDASATHHLSFIHYNIQSLMQKNRCFVYRAT